MTTIFKRLLLIILLTCFSMSVFSADKSKKNKPPTDFQKGLTAYNKDDFATALMLWFPLAEAGDAQAQFRLGKMYLDQKDQRKDPSEAASWIKNLLCKIISKHKHY